MVEDQDAGGAPRKEKHNPFHPVNVRIENKIHNGVSDYDGNRGSQHHHKWLIRWTAALAIFTFCLFIAATVNAVFLRKQINDARDAQVGDQRAYVYAEPYRAFHIDGYGGILQVYTIIGNSGRTSAKNVVRYARIDVLPPTPDPSSNGHIDREEGSAVLSPQRTIPIIKNWNRMVNPDEAQKIKSGSLKVYVFGKILYDDVFGNTWETDFCNAYSGDEGLNFSVGKGASFGYEGWQAKPCEKGNDEKPGTRPN
jgi:hypothetical protein